MSHEYKTERSLAILTILYMLFLFAVFATAQGGDDAYDFPVRGGTEQWKAFKSHGEMVETCRIPEHTLASMSTAGLIKTCLDYPLLMDIVAFDDLQYGFYRIMEEFNGLKELMKREDAAVKLLTLYISMKPEAFDKQWSLAQKGDYAFRLMMVEMILAQEPILQSLSLNDRKQLVTIGLEKIESRKSYTEVYGLYNQIPAHLLVGRVLKDLDFKPFTDKLSNSEFNRFLKDGTTPNHDSFIQEIRFMGKGFLHPECLKKSNPDRGPHIRKDTTIHTPKGSSVKVQVYDNEPCTPADLESYTEYNLDNYPQAIILSPATGKYNCHSYGWIKEDTSNNIWMSNPDPFLYDGSYDSTTEVKLNYRIVYYKIFILSIPPWVEDTTITIEHTATYVPNSSKPVTSKWGKSPRYAHELTYVPYDTSHITFFVYPNSTDIDEAIKKTPSLINPWQSNGRITLTLMECAVPTQVQVFNMAGQIVYKNSFINRKNVVVDLGKHARGMYTVKQKSRKGTIVSKVVFQ